MTRPPLARFLDDSVSRFGDAVDGTEAVSETAAELGSVLAEILSRTRLEAVAEETGLDPKLLESIVDGTALGTDQSDAMLTLETAAAILATASSFSATEIRARIRDHLLVLMSRGPVDAESLAAAYGFGDAATLRDKIEGDRPLSLREYARLRVALKG